MTTDFDQLQQDIQLKANLNRLESSGWYSCVCPICHGGSQGRITGGFLFEEDVIAYQCFRASCDSNTVLERNGFVSRRFRELMDAIHVDIPVSIRLSKRRSKQVDISDLEARLYKEHHYKQIDDIPTTSKITDVDSTASRYWTDYLLNRNIDLSRIRFITDGKYKNLPCILFSFYGKIIGYQVISKNGYITETGGNKNIIFLPSGRVPSVSIIVEGAMDALMFPDNMVGVLGSSFTREHAYILRSSGMWIFLPDNEGYSHPFIEQARKYDQWVCTLDHGKDVSELVKKRGRILAAEEIRNGTTKDYDKATLRSNFEGKLCNKMKKGSSTKKRRSY